MTSLSLAAVLQLTMLATGTETYADAHRANQQTGQPIVVMVGAEWCPACVVMKDKIMPQIRVRGILGKVAFAQVNLDHEQRLGRTLTGGGPIPQLIMFRRTADGWRRSKLVGGQSVETVERFISQGVQATEAERPAHAATPAGPLQGQQPTAMRPPPPPPPPTAANQRLSPAEAPVRLTRSQRRLLPFV